MSCVKLTTIMRSVPSVTRRPIQVNRPQLSGVVQHNSNQILRVSAPFHTSKIVRNENKSEQTTDAKQQTEQKATNGTQESKDNKDTIIKQLETQVEDYKNKLIYSLAERENIRRMSNQDVEKAKEYGITSFAKQLLDTADNLSRCLSNIPKEGFTDKKAQTLLEAVTMIEKEYLKILEKNQIIKFNPQGEKFDPNTMNALMQVPSADKEVGSVAAVFKQGFMLKDRVLRPADVSVVAKQ